MSIVSIPMYNIMSVENESTIHNVNAFSAKCMVVEKFCDRLLQIVVSKNFSFKTRMEVFNSFTHKKKQYTL